jgi:hypothetical protein
MKAKIIISGSLLVLSILACNMGASPAPYMPVPPTESKALTESAQTTETLPKDAGNGGGSCANPYLPIIQGATWNYKLTGTVPDTFTRSIVSVETSGFTDEDVFGTGVSRQGKWNCDNGNLIALDPSAGASASVNLKNVSVDFKTTELSGVTLPASIKVGDNWTQNTTIEGTETINGQQIPAKNKFTNTCKAIGLESVTVEAGAFNAMRVECQTVMEITITMQGNPVNTDLTINSINWYAEKTGLVKTSSSGQGFDSTIELTSYKIP